MDKLKIIKKCNPLRIITACTSFLCTRVGGFLYREGRLGSSVGLGGLGGLSGFTGSRSSSAEPSGAVVVPAEALLLLVDVFLRCWLRSVRLDEPECSVL